MADPNVYSQGPGAELARAGQQARGALDDPRVYPSGNVPGQDSVLPQDPTPGTTPPAPPPAGSVTINQSYSIAISAARDELLKLSELLVEANATVMRMRERFQQTPPS